MLLLELLEWGRCTTFWIPSKKSRNSLFLQNVLLIFSELFQFLVYIISTYIQHHPHAICMQSEAQFVYTYLGWYICTYKIHSYTFCTLVVRFEDMNDMPEKKASIINLILFGGSYFNDGIVSCLQTDSIVRLGLL